MDHGENGTCARTRRSRQGGRSTREARAHGQPQHGRRKRIGRQAQRVGCGGRGGLSDAVRAGAPERPRGTGTKNRRTGRCAGTPAAASAAAAVTATGVCLPSIRRGSRRTGDAPRPPGPHCGHVCLSGEDRSLCAANPRRRVRPPARRLLSSARPYHSCRQPARPRRILLGEGLLPWCASGLVFAVA
jgi:hypothetical protein